MRAELFTHFWKKVQIYVPINETYIFFLASLVASKCGTSKSSQMNATLDALAKKKALQIRFELLKCKTGQEWEQTYV